MTLVGEFPRLTKRSMKRHSESMDEECNVSYRKRRYEERMSSQLDNFHINDNVKAAGIHVVEELQDWGVDDSVNAVDSTTAIVEEPSNGEHSGGIELSGYLRGYIDACKKRDDLVFLKKPKTGLELVLYREPNIDATRHQQEEDDIRNRIVEIADWIETDNEPIGYAQYVTFPTGSTSHSGSDSESTRSVSPEAAAAGDSGVNSLDSNAPTVQMADEAEEEEMEID